MHDQIHHHSAISATTLIAVQAPCHARIPAFRSLDAGATTSTRLVHKTGRRVGAGIAAFGLLGVAAIAIQARARENNHSEHEHHPQRR